MNQEEYLPVGSVVLLKEAERPVVVIGYSVIEENSQEVWDYLGCAYPVGVLSSDKNLLFQKNQIEKVYYRGYCDQECQQFLDLLKQDMEKVRHGRIEL